MAIKGAREVRFTPLKPWARYRARRPRLTRRRRERDDMGGGWLLRKGYAGQKKPRHGDVAGFLP